MLFLLDYFLFQSLVYLMALELTQMLAVTHCLKSLIEVILQLLFNEWKQNDLEQNLSVEESTKQTLNSEVLFGDL